MKQKFYILKKGCAQGKEGNCWIEMIGYTFHFASFENLAQAKKFFDIFGVKFSIFSGDEYMDIFELDKTFIDGGLFWTLCELPNKKKKIKALSNGSLVDCYYTEKRKEVLFYRPNPNAKNVYKPLSVDEHIKHQKENGIY